MKSEPYIWEVSRSPYTSEFLSENLQFGTSNPIFLIDQFSGKRPAILNKEFLEQGNIQFQMFPSSLLDSNVLDQLDRFVQKGQSTDGFLEFIRFLCQRGWDSSAMFYYLEHFAKSTLEDFRSNATRRTESLLKIHSMNDPHFLKTGEITPSKEAVEHYLTTFGCRSLQEVAVQRVESFMQKYKKSDFLAMIEASEIALIKMLLIRKHEMTKASPVEQYREFIRFMKNDLGFLLAREAHLAIHYFCDNAGRLLGIQSSTPKQRAFSTIKSTAWDLYLLRMPELMFTESPSEVCIAYVSTQEKQLQALAKLFTVERIICFKDIGVTPLIGFSMEGLPEAVKDQLEDELVPVSSHKSKCVPVGLNQALFNQLERFCA